MSTAKKAILFVDDQQPVLDSLRRMLRPQCDVWDMSYLNCSKTAWEQLLTKKFDLVVSDVVMPEMDGPTLLTKLRGRYPDVKIIFVSGYAEDAFERNLPEGDKYKYNFLAKPFTLKQLVGAVKEAMN